MAKQNSFNLGNKTMNKPPLKFPKVAATSIAAHNSIQPVAGTLEYEVYRAIIEAGSAGMTNEEIVTKTKVLLQTTCGRVNSLVKKGLVKDSGTTRLTQTQRRATVWVQA